MTELEKSEHWDLYDPDWEPKWQMHKNAFDQALASNGDTEKHLSNMHETWIAQFHNAKEYADHILGSLAKKATAQELFWSVIDTSALKTLEDVNQAYNKASRFLEDQQKEFRGGLPVDSSGLFATEKTRSMNLTFDAPRFATQCVTSIEEKEDALNVCFTHTGNNSGTSVVNGIELLATRLYHNGLHKKVSAPDNINWYIHLPAKETSMGEKFMRVKMTLIDNEFAFPDFHHLENVPAAIKRATFNAAQDEIGIVPFQTQDDNRRRLPNQPRRLG